MDEPDFATRCSRELAFAPRLRADERFSHVSAARIWDMPLPRSTDPRIHLVTSLDRNRRERADVLSHRRAGTSARVAGMNVSSPVETFIELGTILQLHDLVAVGDWLALTPRRPAPGDRRPYASPAVLQRIAAERRAWGIRKARRAAELVREGAESPKETALRLLLEQAGFPPPECGVAVLDQRGTFIGYFDMVWPEHRVIVEYDGDQHRTDTVQYEKDIRRFDQATAAGWRVIRVRAHGLTLRGRPDTIARVRDAFTSIPRH